MPIKRNLRRGLYKERSAKPADRPENEAALGHNVNREFAKAMEALIGFHGAHDALLHAIIMFENELNHLDLGIEAHYQSYNDDGDSTFIQVDSNSEFTRPPMQAMPSFILARREEIPNANEVANFVDLGSIDFSAIEARIMASVESRVLQSPHDTILLSRLSEMNPAIARSRRASVLRIIGDNNEITQEFMRLSRLQEELENYSEDAAERLENGMVTLSRRIETLLNPGNPDRANLLYPLHPRSPMVESEQASPGEALGLTNGELTVRIGGSPQLSRPPGVIRDRDGWVYPRSPRDLVISRLAEYTNSGGTTRLRMRLNNHDSYATEIMIRAISLRTETMDPGFWQSIRGRVPEIRTIATITTWAGSTIDCTFDNIRTITPDNIIILERIERGWIAMQAGDPLEQWFETGSEVTF